MSAYHRHIHSISRIFSPPTFFMASKLNYSKGTAKRSSLTDRIKFTRLVVSVCAMHTQLLPYSSNKTCPMPITHACTKTALHHSCVTYGVTATPLRTTNNSRYYSLDLTNPLDNTPTGPIPSIPSWHCQRYTNSCRTVFDASHFVFS